jgi:hypothetical protein
MRNPDEDRESPVLLDVGRLRTAAPGVVAGTRDFQGVAQRGDGIRRLLRADELES